MVATAAQAVPFHDKIPESYFGIYGPNIVACSDQDGVDLMSIDANGMYYYEGENYLLLGVAFDGQGTVKKDFIPLFNGRFTGRMETQILGEMSARLELENANTLAVFAIGENGEPTAKSRSVWIRCLNRPPNSK